MCVESSSCKWIFLMLVYWYWYIPHPFLRNRFYSSCKIVIFFLIILRNWKLKCRGYFMEMFYKVCGKAFCWYFGKTSVNVTCHTVGLLKSIWKIIIIFVLSQRIYQSVFLYLEIYTCVSSYDLSNLENLVDYSLLIVRILLNSHSFTHTHSLHWAA